MGPFETGAHRLMPVYGMATHSLGVGGRSILPLPAADAIPVSHPDLDTAVPGGQPASQPARCAARQAGEEKKTPFGVSALLKGPSTGGS